MVQVALALTAIIVLGAFGVALTAFAQTETSEQTTLSGEYLANDPIAQDILKKIELTKQWIADLEQRDYEKTQAQKFLDEKRAIALDRLNQDLKDWEILWESYSSRASFERFVDKVPSAMQGVFWDSFEFKEMKVKAGRDALKQVIADGGSLKEAREAYIQAAETKRIELIEVNNQFNVKHNLAYYKQQILFDSQGKFISTPQSVSSLSQYYTDYRADPAYHAANLDDTLSYDDIGETTPYTQCRDGYLVIHRLHADDYVCVTEATAEMWIQHGMGEILGTEITSILDENSLNPNVRTNPLTQCQDGFKVVYVLSSQEYSCITESTADKWISSDIAELPNVEQYIFDQIQDKEIHTLILDANEKIKIINDEFELNKIELKEKYEKIYKDAEIQTDADEKLVLEKFYSNSTMTKQELSKQIMEIRKLHESTKENILDEKSENLDALEDEYHEKILEIRKQYDDDKSLGIKIVWNADISDYEAVKQ